jgi:hypothetical protein
MNAKDKSAKPKRKGAPSPERIRRLNDAVGYGQPPTETRFKPGLSGNPKGRPRGSKNLKGLIKQAMTAPIHIQEGQISRRVSKIEGVVLRQLQSALKGSDRAALAIIKMAMQMGFLEEPEGRTEEADALTATDLQILEQLRSGYRKEQ